jgi:hypothetical protein
MFSSRHDAELLVGDVEMVCGRATALLDRSCFAIPTPATASSESDGGSSRTDDVRVVPRLDPLLA